MFFICIHDFWKVAAKIKFSKPNSRDHRVQFGDVFGYSPILIPAIMWGISLFLGWDPRPQIKAMKQVAGKFKLRLFAISLFSTKFASDLIKTTMKSESMWSRGQTITSDNGLFIEYSSGTRGLSLDSLEIVQKFYLLANIFTEEAHALLKVKQFKNSGTLLYFRNKP
ncbi:hypothetical protein Cgig2_001625 [Carnegiea gigantea]|uniref:Uncharacterized protein n=1 Tax=Carnegiea gigantea TaxID=171969 RepID=A0A9Q1JIB9_9CARY|nr:hypothetical protein Cgig2_001625 [Carnegiea gigantea]